jgi:hypothetical protein
VVANITQGDSVHHSLLTRPRNQISACAVLMSGVVTVAERNNLASYAAVRIPDIRIELRSKRIPGTREEGLLP